MPLRALFMPFTMVLTLLCISAADADAQGLPPPPPPPPPPMVTGAEVSARPLETGTGLILGRVVEAGTTTAVPDAMVTLAGAALGVSGQRFSNGVAAGQRVTVADSTGRFLFRDLPVGNYQITAAAQGFSSAGYQQARPNQVRRSLDLPRPVELAAGEKRGDVVISLWRHAGVTGAVVDAAGEPVVGLTVSVLTRTLVSGQPVMQNYATAVTDDRGIYWAEVVPGDYVVGVLTAPTTMPNALIDEFTQTLAAGGDGVAAFYGRLNAAGLPFPGVVGVRMGAMTVTPSRPGWIAPPLMTTDGRLYAYPTTFHPSASSAATAAIVTVRSGEEKPAVNIQVTPRPLLRVSGRLLGADGPMPGVVVRLITIDPATTMSSPPSQIDEAVAMTGADGRFLFPGVAPGQYRIRMLQAPAPQNRAIANTAPTWWAMQEVSVGNDDIDGLDITAKRGARFRGRVVFDGTPTPADTDALRNVTVFPRAVPGTNGSLALVTAGVGTPTATGEYSSAEFVPGLYVLEALNLPRNWIVKSVMARGQDAADVPVELPEGGLDNIVVTLTDKISHVVGVVRGSSDKTAGNATVGVFPVDRTMWRRVGMQSRRTQTFIPRRDGVFLIAGLPPGEYYIVATEGEVPDFSDPVVLTSLVPSAVKITIAPGEKKTLELRSVIHK